MHVSLENAPRTFQRCDEFFGFHWQLRSNLANGGQCGAWKLERASQVGGWADFAKNLCTSSFNYCYCKIPTNGAIFSQIHLDGHYL
jgi:hypothetical protein